MPMHYRKDGEWRELRFGGPAPDDWASAEERKRAAVGSTYRLHAWRDVGGDFLLDAWLDHWLGDTGVWGLLFYQAAGTFKTSNVLYEIAGNRLSAVQNDGNQIGPPVEKYHHSWWSTATGAVSTIHPSNSSSPSTKLAGGTSGMTGGRFYWSAPLATGPMAAGGVHVGIAHYAYSLPAHLAAGPSALRGTLDLDGVYTRKPGVTDADLIV